MQLACAADGMGTIAVRRADAVVGRAGPGQRAAVYLAASAAARRNRSCLLPGQFRDLVVDLFLFAQHALGLGLFQLDVAVDLGLECLVLLFLRFNLFVRDLEIVGVVLLLLAVGLQRSLLLLDAEF